MSERFVSGVHLTRTDEAVAEVAELVGRAGGAVGLSGVVDDLNRDGYLVRFRRPGRAVDRCIAFDRFDQVTTQWYPQGISTSADSSDTEDIDGRALVVITWYSKSGRGVRLTFLDVETHQYRHVLVVVPEFTSRGRFRIRPLQVHAGGVVWFGPYLHIAATSNGFITCRADDIVSIPDAAAHPDRHGIGVEGDRLATAGYRYVIPVRFRHRAFSDEGVPKLRYSSLSLDRSETPYSLMTAEYGRRDQTTRVARFPLDHATALPETGDDGCQRPVLLTDAALMGMQGLVRVKGTYYATVSHGTAVQGSVYVGRPGAFRRHRLATPIGPEDLSYWPSRDELWSVSEHPRRRYVYAMRRARFR